MIDELVHYRATSAILLFHDILAAHDEHAQQTLHNNKIERSTDRLVLSNEVFGCYLMNSHAAKNSLNNQNSLNVFLKYMFIILYYYIQVWSENAQKSVLGFSIF